ncbi:MAG: class I SAM-dependent methyltransferase, partial [Planctomycetota bacterium]|nr:class I SAM-dependent methyltransferase [Planctomycetota bacterium]
MMNEKKNTLSRVCRNAVRIARSCTPPFLQKVLCMEAKTKHDVPRLPCPTTNQPGIAFLIPALQPIEVWPEFEQTEVTMLPRQIRNHLWAMPENELMVLSTICRILNPKRIFEFGTFTGASTLAIAANTENDAKIHTLDIPPGDRRSHRTGVGSDIPFDFKIGQAFLETKWEEKIEIHQADTREFDTSPYSGTMDLVFVDADHTYEFVKNDSRKAMEMLSPG